jgi:uncharacterized membrane protein
MHTLINGSPTHALIVHAVVVLLPLSVLCALLLVFVPSSRRAFGLVSVGVALVGCLAVPLAFLSGGDLRQRVPPSPLISHHVALAHQLPPVAAVFGVVLAAFVYIDLVRRARADELNRVETALLARATGITSWGSPVTMKLLSRATAILLVVMAIATSVAVVRVGDSGAKAVWHGRLSTPQV